MTECSPCRAVWGGSGRRTRTDTRLVPQCAHPHVWRVLMSGETPYHSTHLPSPFCRKANNFRGLFVFLPSYVATIKSAYTKIYLDINLWICHSSSHYVCRYFT